MYRVGDEIATRHAAADALADLGRERNDLAVLDAGVEDSTGSCKFKESYPNHMLPIIHSSNQ